MPRFASILAFSASLALIACSGDDTGTDSDTATTTNSGTTTAGTDTETGGTGGSLMDQYCKSGEPTPSGGTNLMEEWGAPCTTDDECVALIGDGATCLMDILDIYLLPKGYCAKLCSLPDANTKYVPDDPVCGTGRTCLGAKDFFEACAVPCTSDDECQRDGYTCQILPQLGADGEPKFCLMQPNCTNACVMGDPMCPPP